MSGVDIYDATFEIDRKGGFTAAVLDVCPPAGVDTLDDRVDSGIVLRDPVDGFVLWEGRVDDPESVPQRASKARLECGGYICALEDDESFVRNYVDSDMTHWETRQCTRYADRFTVELVDSGEDPMLTMYVVTDVEVPDGANARAFWYPFGAERGECARIVKFTITATAIEDTLRVRLYSRDAAPNSGERTLEYDCYEDCSSSPQSVNITAGAQSLVWRIEQGTVD